MVGNGGKTGDITIFLQLYNKYKSDFFLHLPVTSKGGKQRHTGLWTLPHIQWGKKEGTILKCRRPAQYMWATWRLHSKGRFVGYKSVRGQF